MPTDRVLIEIVTAANMAGVEQAKAGLLRLTPATIALTAAVGGLILVGKSAVENTQAQQHAHELLKQAVDANNSSLHGAIVTHADVTKETEALAAAQRHQLEMWTALPPASRRTKEEIMRYQDACNAVAKAQAALTKAQGETTTSMATQAINLGELQGEYDNFAEVNKRYIADQYDTEAALAALIRAGNGTKDSFRLLNDSLDLATIKSVSVSEAEGMLEKAMMGQSRALRDLGISSTEYNAIMTDKTLTTEQKHLKLMDLIETKTKDGRKAQTDLTQSTQALNKDWQDMSTKIGPPLLDLFTGLVGWADKFVTALNDLGNNRDWNKGLSDFLGVIQNSIEQDVQWVENVIADINALKAWVGSHNQGGSNINFQGTSPFPAASGFEGTVTKPTMFLAGEAGSEHVSITPHGGGPSGGSTVNIHIGTMIGDGPSIDRFANEIARRLSYATGR